MYENLIETLRFCAKNGDCHDCPYEKPCAGTMGDGLYCEAADAIEDLIAALTASNEVIAKSKTRWIPVAERLPEHEYGESTSVLTVDLYGVMRVTYFDGGNWCWPSGEALTTMRVAPITNWMSLPPAPEPPKEET